VAGLKTLIKNENPEAFPDVPARSLGLWKVSMLVDKSFGEKARDMELREEEVLSPVTPLSRVFTDTPVDGHVHIIVRPHAFGEYKGLS
jgi:hypothetical protein